MIEDHIFIDLKGDVLGHAALELTDRAKKFLCLVIEVFYSFAFMFYAAEVAVLRTKSENSAAASR